MALTGDEDEALPHAARVSEHLREQLAGASIEAAVLEQGAPLPATYRAVAESEVRSILT
jgi:hypothetical protein